MHLFSSRPSRVPATGSRSPSQADGGSVTLAAVPHGEVIPDPAARQQEFNKKMKEMSLRPRHGHGRRTSDTIQHELTRTLPMPLLKPPYRELDPADWREEVRLVRLHPGKGTDPIRCTLHHEYLSSKKHSAYETVSYRWDGERAVIEVNRIAVVVPQSAAQVLHVVRLPDRERMVWIDAICINQADAVEKGQQVSIMGDIYRKTRRNLIFLGDDHGTASVVQRTIKAVMNNIRARAGTTKDWYGELMLKDGRFPENCDLLDLNIDLEPLVVLFSCSWFTRIWICQEARLPPESQCYFGRTVLALSDVLSVARWLAIHLDWLPKKLSQLPGFEGAIGLWWLFQPLFRTDGLYDVYRLLRNFEASEPRDRIYGLLGMYKTNTHATAREGVQRLRLLRPDYGKPEVSIFQDATRAMIEDSESLDILHYVDILNPTPGFPSWVVDFGKKQLGPHDNLCERGSEDAGCGLLVDWGVSLDQARPYLRELPTLALLGRPVDVVWRCTRRLDIEGSHRSEFCAIIREIGVLMTGEKARRGAARGASLERNYDVAHTLVAGTNIEHKSFTEPDLDDFTEFLKQITQYTSLKPGSSKGDEEIMKAERYVAAMSHASHDRVIFILRNGLLGNGPKTMQPGDHVVVFPGARVPLILRPLEHDDEYSFVGECYVHGIMAGEVITDTKRFEPVRHPYFIR